MRLALPAALLLQAQLCLALLNGCGAATEDTNVARRAGSDLFLAGSHVQVSEATSGDLIAAGSSVDVAAPVAGDAMVAGAELRLSGPFGADLYAAGARLNVDAHVAGSLRAAGASVRLAPTSDVRHGVSVAASDAEIGGVLHDYLQVAAATTRLGANVQGDVDVTGESLELLPSAVIHGALTFRGPKPPTLAPQARVLGGMQHVAPPPAPRWLAYGVSLVSLLGLVLAAGILFALWPNYSRSLGQIAAQRTARALLTGIAVFISMPIVIVLLFVSIIGLPLGLLTLYAYLLLLPLGYLTCNMAISDALLRFASPRSEQHWQLRLLVLAGVLFVQAVLITPLLFGKALALVLCTIGMGSLILSLSESFRRRRRRQADEPPELDPHSAPQAG